jgi:hypothetical protein
MKPVHETVERLVRGLLDEAAVGMRTPWGKADNVEQVAPGIAFVSTPSHGGYKLEPSANQKVNAVWRQSGGWYEEDVDYAIVHFSFPNIFGSSKVEAARKTLKHWRPDGYEKVTGETVSAADSLKRREQEFMKQHANDWQAYAAWGDWHEKVPKGMVGVVARKGGRDGSGPEKYFLVPEHEYDTRGGQSFIVDPSKHKEYPGRF